jgi:MFS family permease
MGTMIEWYDFYIFGSLAVVISTKFFPSDNPTAAFLSTLATFAAGFVVRPFGALFFGRLGDLIGRKYTFMVTLLLMGGATFLIGCIPSYETIGFMAPLLVLILRLLQGLALGGEYGGAATYVAEHAPVGQRGYWTSWIQTTATVGLFISLMVILATKNLLSPEEFDAWGWRVPFWVSIIMVGVSYLIRKNMSGVSGFCQSEIRRKNQYQSAEGKFREPLQPQICFTGAIWRYDGTRCGLVQAILRHEFHENRHVYRFLPSRYFIGYRVDYRYTVLHIVRLVKRQDGRKFIMMGGMLLAILLYRPIYKQMYETTNVKNKTEITQKTTFLAELKENSKAGKDSVYTTHKEFTDGTTWLEIKTVTLENGQPLMVDGKVKSDTKTTVNINKTDEWMLIFLIFIQVIFVTMVYGPIAAFLVEMFPAKIRYTSMSLPYHVGNGIFGGLLPAISTYFVTHAKDAGDPEFYLEGLWYPIVIAAVCFVIGMIYISNNKKNIHI